MSNKKTNRMETFQTGGAIPARDAYTDAMHRALIDQMYHRYSAIPTTMFAPGSDSKFAGSEFTMGTAVGVRSWNVDRLGRLESPSYKTVWAPGEMTAQCAVGPFDWVTLTRRPTQHQQSSCSCGFYAYYEGFNEYAKPERVTGIIEGYGETQIGTRGFKSAKARIVALCVPDDSADIQRIGKTPFARVRDNYGQHVAIFSDYAQMAAEFPTTQPQDAPTPETDPDFWTRGI